MKEVSDRSYKQQLRKQAEEFITQHPSAVEKIPPQTVQKLIENLQVHQIELEMQNEELRQAQSEIEEARDKYSDLYDFAPVGYVTIEENGLIKEANLTGAALLGVVRSALLGKRFSSFVARDAQPAFHRFRQKLLEKKTLQSQELELVTKDGAQFHALLESRPVLDDAGNCRQFRTTITDVSELKQAETALKASEERLALALEGGDLGIWDLDVEAGEVIWSKRWSEMLGYAPAEVDGKFQTWTELIHPDDKAAALGAFDAHMEGQAEFYQSEHRLKTRSGEWKWVLDLGKVSARDESGKPLRVTGTIRDIEKRKEAEANLQASDGRYRLLTETMKDGLAVQDANGLISSVNESLCRMLGYTRGELIGLTVRAILGANHQSLHDAVTGNEQNGQLSFAVKRERKDGRTIHVSVSAQSLIAADGQLKGSFVLVTDITELRKLRERIELEDGFQGMVGRDVLMLELFDTIRVVAGSDFPVLIQGESGTGKELVALAIHGLSRRSGGRFVPINCGALPEGLLESELFGHVRGAFTDAVRDKKGRFELAEGGTLFFDEVAELSPALQVKLLRILQEGTFERVGGEKTLRTNVRIISATNKDLQKDVAAGKFREDLFYRLCVIPINIPTLRERPGDISLLVAHFLDQNSKESRKERCTISSDALSLLLAHRWPGNIRELQNIIQFAIMKSQGKPIERQHLPENLLSISKKRRTKKQYQRKLEARAVEEALRKTNGKKTEAAKLLGVSRATLYRFINEVMKEDGVDLE